MLVWICVALIIIYIILSVKDGFVDWDGNKNQKNENAGGKDNASEA